MYIHLYVSTVIYIYSVSKVGALVYLLINTLYLLYKFTREARTRERERVEREKSLFIQVKRPILFKES